MLERTFQKSDEEEQYSCFGFRNLPGDARQTKTQKELTSELPIEGLTAV